MNANWDLWEHPGAAVTADDVAQANRSCPPRKTSGRSTVPTEAWRQLADSSAQLSAPYLNPTPQEAGTRALTIGCDTEPTRLETAASQSHVQDTPPPTEKFDWWRETIVKLWAKEASPKKSNSCARSRPSTRAANGSA